MLCYIMPYSLTNDVFLRRCDMFRLGRGLVSGYGSLSEAIVVFTLFAAVLFQSAAGVK